MDNLIGIFDNYTEDTKAPTVDLGIRRPDSSLSGGKKMSVPTAAAYDNSMEKIPVSCIVTNKSGADITAEAIAGTYIVRENEEYKIVYTATDKSGNVGTKTVEVEVLPRADIPDTEKSDYFPAARDYDILQDFEGGGVDWSTVENSFETDHVMNGEKSVRLSTTSADCCVVEASKTKRLETKLGKICVYSGLRMRTAKGRDLILRQNHYLQLGPNVITITSRK
ncbi:MAG: hypothetical protein ACLRSW_06040 [Christensenellaceae bacterium]